MKRHTHFFLDDGDILSFFSEEDRDLYQQYYNLEKAGIELRHGNKPREKYVSSTTFYNKFIGYNPLTPSWSYASSYTISRGKNLSFSTGYTYSGTSTTLTVSNSYGVAVTLPANSKKASRLAAKADIPVARYKVELYNGATVLQTFYTLRTTKVKNVTNYVHYSNFPFVKNSYLESPRIFCVGILLLLYVNMMPSNQLLHTFSPLSLHYQ